MKKVIQKKLILGTILFIGSIWSFNGVLASANRITSAVTGEKRELGSFDKLDVSGAYTITLVQGDVESVVIDASADLASKVITKVEGGTLKIYNDKNFMSEEKISLAVNFRNLTGIDCSGANVINSSGALKFTNLSFDASGACKANLEFNVINLDIDMSGTVNAVMKGNASKVDLDISGAGKLQAADLAASDYDVEISGTGNAEINASKTLNVEVSGTGSVKYKGAPKVTKEISGSGNVTQIH